jgi:hypothetical protein
MQRKHVSLMLLLVCGSLFGEDAAMFRGNPLHSGVYDGSAGAKVSGVKWKFSYWRHGDRFAQCCPWLVVRGQHGRQTVCN